MGNCIMKESSMRWGGDNWEADFPTTSGRHHQHHRHHHKHPSTSISYHNSDNDTIKLFNPSSSSSSSMSSDTYNDDDITSKRRRNMPDQHQVKIKITRKQLEELLGVSKIINHIEDEGQRLTMVQEVVHHFLNAGNDFLDSHQRSWRPALSTITEVN